MQRSIDNSNKMKQDVINKLIYHAEEVVLVFAIDKALTQRDFTALEKLRNIKYPEVSKDS